MSGERIFKEIVIEGLIIFTTYLLTVAIGYYVLESIPFITALFAPYL